MPTFPFIHDDMSFDISRFKNKNTTQWEQTSGHIFSPLFFFSLQVSFQFLLDLKPQA